MGDRQPANFRRLAGLVGDVDRFAGEHWGRRPLHRSGATWVPEFAIADVESLLDTSARSPSIRLVQDGRPRPTSEWTSRVRLGGVDLDDVADGRKVAAAFADGASIVLQGLHRTWPSLVRYASDVQREISHPVQVNAYLTPPNSRGLGQHSDAHDVFVVQRVGWKRWWVDGLGDISLCEGDVLYVPAAVAHRAESVDTVSLHLTIGVLRRTRRHVVERALRDVTALDQPLPLGFSRDDATTVELIDQAMQDAAVALRGGVDIGRLVESLVVGARQAGAGGQLQAVADAAAIDADTTIAWRRSNRVVVEGEGATIRSGDRWLTVPAVALQAVCDLRDAGVRTVGDLLGLDPPGRLVLARRLVREGFADVDLAAVPDRSRR